MLLSNFTDIKETIVALIRTLQKKKRKLSLQFQFFFLCFLCMNLTKSTIDITNKCSPNICIHVDIWHKSEKNNRNNNQQNIFYDEFVLQTYEVTTNQLGKSRANSTRMWFLPLDL